jgi:hypothetical protein
MAAILNQNGHIEIILMQHFRVKLSHKQLRSHKSFENPTSGRKNFFESRKKTIEIGEAMTLEARKLLLVLFFHTMARMSSYMTNIRTFSLIKQREKKNVKLKQKKN